MSEPLAEAEPALRASAGLRRQCLFAVTILLVEDSRSASEAIRLFAAESGARVRRADSLHAASRHLAIYRPNVVMVDLGLPDGDGLALVRHLASAATPITAIVALSGHERGGWQAEATLAGAAACLEKPIPSLRAFQECVLSVLPDADSPPRPRRTRDVALDGRASVRAALEEDLRRARALLAEALPAGDAETVAYCAQFVGSVGEMLGDRDLAAAARRAVAARRRRPPRRRAHRPHRGPRRRPRGRCRLTAADGASARSHADRAVEADDAAVQHRVLRDLDDERPELVRLAEPGGKGHLPAEARLDLGGQPLEHRRQEQARRDRDRPHPGPARSRAIGRVIAATAPFEAA